MRKLPLPVAAWILIFASCSKSGPADNGCIERNFIYKTDPVLTPSQTKTADSLLAVNNIDHSSFLYFFLGHDTFHIQSTFIDDYTIYMDQYTNGLRILNEQLSYTFYNGVIQYKCCTLTKGTSLDTVPHLNLTRLRQLFTDDLRSHSKMTTPGLTDSCYKAEFGYYNLASTSTEENLVKAWLVTLSSAQYPFAYYPAGIYRDDNGKSISFVGNIFMIDPF